MGQLYVCGLKCHIPHVGITSGTYTANKWVKNEERGKLLGTLTQANLGVREIEEFVRNEDKKFTLTNWYLKVPWDDN